MFGVGDGDARAVCGYVFGLCSKDTRTAPLASCWCLYCQFWAWLASCSGVFSADFGQVNAGCVLVILMTRFLLTNDLFDWFIYFAVIFCSIYTVNITNFNNYLIYIMKLQVFIVLWSALVLGWRFVATNQFISIAGWLDAFCMVRVFGWWEFWTDSSTWSTF